MTTEAPTITLEALKAQLGEAIAKGDIAEMIRLGNRIKTHPDAKVVLETIAKKEASVKAEEAKAKDAGLAEIKDGAVWETERAKALKVTGLHVQLDADAKTVFTGGKVSGERKAGG